MRALTIALTVAALGPALLCAQGPNAGSARAAAVLTIRVPSIVKYRIDETVRTPEGYPTLRVISNDPAIRAAFAQGATPERVALVSAGATPEQSAHSKGGEALEPAAARAQGIRYTVVAP